MIAHAYLKSSTPVEVAANDIIMAGGDILIASAVNNEGLKTIVFSANCGLQEFSEELNMDNYVRLEKH